MSKNRFVLVLFTVLMILGMSGCINEKKSEETKNIIYESVKSKYNRDFTIEYFRQARDSTYTNILTLSDGTHIFNAYKKENDEYVSDNLIDVVLSKKITDDIIVDSGLSDADLKVYSEALLEKKKNYALDDALSLEADDVLSDNTLIKLVLIVCSTDPLESYKDQLFNLYKSAITHNPEVIDIELVQTKNVDDPDLLKMLNNLPAHYDDEFERFNSVIEYYSIKDLDLTSCDELFRR